MKKRGKKPKKSIKEVEPGGPVSSLIARRAQKVPPTHGPMSESIVDYLPEK